MPALVLAFAKLGFEAAVAEVYRIAGFMAYATTCFGFCPEILRRWNGLAELEGSDGSHRGVMGAVFGLTRSLW